MKKLFTIILVLNTVYSFAQNIPGAVLLRMQKPAKKDTIIAESDTSTENKEPRYFYLAGNTNVFVNTKGGFGKRFSPSLEFGKTYGIFDIGVAVGRLNTLASDVKDTSRFIEIRPTINIFSKGRFSEGLCLAAGYVINAKQGLMTEICNSINFNITEIYTVSVVQGFYYIDGTNSNRVNQYMGINFTYNFLKRHGVNIKRKHAAIISDN